MIHYKIAAAVTIPTAVITNSFAAFLLSEELGAGRPLSYVIAVTIGAALLVTFGLIVYDPGE